MKKIPGVIVVWADRMFKLATMSGTSMAAPHACGVLLATGGKPGFLGYVTGDPDEESDAIIHK